MRTLLAVAALLAVTYGYDVHAIVCALLAVAYAPTRRSWIGREWDAAISRNGSTLFEGSRDDA